jgi:glycosyltransferase involved in cell wall biosynthesis
MDLTLVITTYKRPEQLTRALRSAEQLRPSNTLQAELLVVDNNSPPDTRAAFDAVAARWSGLPLRYAFEPCQGVSHARNRAIAESQASWIAYMDDEQTIDPDYLVEFEQARHWPSAQCMGGPIRYANAHSLPLWLPPLIRTIGQIDLGPESIELDPARTLLKGGNFAVRRKTLDVIGGFDARLGRVGGQLLAAEEDDLQTRLYARGGKILYWPGLLQWNYLEPEKLTKAYWRRHAVGSGRTQRLRLGAETAFAPWRVRGLLNAAWQWAWCALRRSPDAFERELDLWEAIGGLKG